jgi:hypothetical protein
MLSAASPSYEEVNRVSGYTRFGFFKLATFFFWFPYAIYRSGRHTAENVFETNNLIGCRELCSFLFFGLTRRPYQVVSLYVPFHFYDWDVRRTNNCSRNGGWL